MFAEKKTVNLRTVADYVGLAPCSISAVLNDTDAAKAIPQATKDRIFRAVAELNYRPNLWARSLRTKRTRMVAAIAPDSGREAAARVIACLQKRLQQKGYLLALGTLDQQDATQFFTQLQQRGIEGLIAIDTRVPRHLELPVASVDLAYLGELELQSAGVLGWLQELGNSAAETIMRQIEKPSTSKRVRVSAKVPTDFIAQEASFSAGMRASA